MTDNVVFAIVFLPPWMFPLRRADYFALTRNIRDEKLFQTFVQPSRNTLKGSKLFYSLIYTKGQSFGQFHFLTCIRMQTFLVGLVKEISCNCVNLFVQKPCSVMVGSVCLVLRTFFRKVSHICYCIVEITLF